LAWGVLGSFRPVNVRVLFARAPRELSYIGKFLPKFQSRSSCLDLSPVALLTKSHRSDTFTNVTDRLLYKQQEPGMFIRTTSDLGALIRERRLKLGLDQVSLARKAGTSRKWVVEVEKGKPRAEMGLILRTLKALGVTLAVADATSNVPSKSVRTPAPVVDINQVIDSLKRRR